MTSTITSSKLQPVKDSNNVYIKHSRLPIKRCAIPSSISSKYPFITNSLSFYLREVKGEQILIQYTLYSPTLITPFDWHSTLPECPFLLEMKVGRTITFFEIQYELLYRSYTVNGNSYTASFRRVSDVRGYFDSFILNDWSVLDICFYLRTLSLNYLVDSHPLSPTLNTWKAIVYKHELLAKERFSKITGSDFSLSLDDKEKLNWVLSMEHQLQFL